MHARQASRTANTCASCPALLSAGFPIIRCPHCSCILDRRVLARMCPDGLQTLDDALTVAWLEAHGIIRCVCACLLRAMVAAAALDSQR
jgi:hypothetical protein